MIRVASCQAAPDVEAPGPAWSRALTLAGEAAAQGARLIVLPELTSSGYVLSSTQEASRLSSPADGSHVAELAELSAELGVVIVCGWAERADGGPFNSAVVVDGGRVLGVYRKAHLWGEEPRWFTPGDGPPLVVDSSVGRVAVMICYDLEFPEWARLARQLGADIIAAPVNWPRLASHGPGVDAGEGRSPLEVAKARAAAGSYRIPVVVADRVGRERGVDWIGGSCLIDRDGYLVAGPDPVDRTAVLVGDVDPAGDTAIGPDNDALRDRRPALYEER